MEQLFQNQRDDERRIGEEYLSSLQDLNCNSKPLINMLTMLADENINHASVIVRVVEYYISQVAPEFKLPILYLIDSIVKNVKSSYVQLFGQCIVKIFLHAFESVQHSQSQVLEKVRERMYALRQTWNEVFPPSKMYALDVQVKRLDNNWPITAKQPTASKIHVNPAIHVNPDFLKPGMVPVMPVTTALPSDMEEILQAKTRELLELKKRKLELELEQTKKHLEEQERQLSQAADAMAAGANSANAAARPAGGDAATGRISRVAAASANSAPAMPNMPASQQQFANKPKVNPVNPALLNSVRQRDPRLARQMQAQAQPPPMARNDPRLEAKSNSATSQKSSRSRSKSPVRNSNSRSGKSSSNSHHSGTSSRKRSESKSSTASSSSSGSDGRQKSDSSSNQSPGKRSNKQSSSKEHSDRYAVNGSPSGSSKRKSSSPSSSPSKSKRGAGNKMPSSRGKSSSGRSRSRSPVFMDLDVQESKAASPLLLHHGTASSAAAAKATAAPNDLEKRPPPAPPSPPIIDVSSKDIDLRRPKTPPPPTFGPSDALLDPRPSGSNSGTTILASGASSASSPSDASTSKLPAKVSFKIQKQFNKLEKSTANLSTASLLNSVATATAGAAAAASAATAPSNATLVMQSSAMPLVSSATSQGNVSDALQQSISKLMKVQVIHGAGEKRPADVLPPEIDEEDKPPQQKRSKSAKLDALFGSEDVDLRREIPAAKPCVPGIIVVEDDSMDNCDETKSTSPPKKATLEELRAKLAKSARLHNKQQGGKCDKGKDPSVLARHKLLAELKTNEDSQEAHVENVRTILSQAHEMLENHSMNPEQYKDLVQKVVAINENSKLKESRRREEELDLERNAARDAVLRKRIPKIKGNENLSSSSPRSDGSPRYDEPANAQDKSQNKRDKSKRENKRRKPSKWGDQVDPAAAQRAAWQLANSNNNNNKRGGMPNQQQVQPGGFRGMPWQQPPAIVMPQGVVPPPPQPPSMMGMPPVPPVVVPLTMNKAINSLDNPMADVVRSITIDGGSKEIRFYNQVAIIFMDGDEPHEIGFQQGQRVIQIDHNDPLPLCFNDDYKPFQLDGQLHRIRFGFPSRELYIDDHWYEIYFGGPPVSVPIGNKIHVLKAEGPPPNVDIGRVRRDLVVGKINMIVDAHTIVPLFLDARQQSFQLGAEQHTLQFVDSFLYALLDGQQQKIEYGGLPKGMKLNGGRSCFIRFGTLPKGVIAGKTHVADMVYIKTEAPAEPPQPPPLIVKQPPVVEQPAAVPASAPAVSLPAAAAALGSLNINELFQKLVSSGIIGGAAPAPASATPGPADAKETAPVAAESATVAAPAAAPAPAPAGPPMEPIKRIDLQKPETIKTRQSAVIATLYLGMQCSSCGVRFPPEQTIKYSQHLDWHFRQNRRDRDSTRKATSRKWYYDLSDWRQYEEIEDVEEREKNFLEAQGQPGGPDAMDELSQQRSVDSPMPTCAAGADDVDRCCDMCHEKFEQFYNEELEEWHLRRAVRVEDKIYHPLCYEDYKASLNPPVEEKASKDVDMNNSDDNAMDTLIKVEEIDDDEDEPAKNVQAFVDDDDDDVIVLPNEEPSVTEIVDDDEDEYVPGNVTRAEMGNESQDHTESQDKLETNGAVKAAEKPDSEKQSQNESDVANESDVEIQEPNIPFTDLDTYVEKEMDEATRAAMLNVKIKEEPKDDYEDDEDDGFEDVGTVVPLLPLPDDEISIHSSETQTQTIGSSASPATIERPASVTSLSLPATEAEEPEPTADASASASASAGAAAVADNELNGEQAQESTHNLSAAGPALPLASIVNKIKINITKNTSSNSHNSASNANTTATATSSTTASSAKTDSQVSAISVIGGGTAAAPVGASGSGEANQQVNAIQTISTIPVLCGGNTFVPKIATSAPANVISSISVIGSSYGGSNSGSASGSGSSNSNGSGNGSRTNSSGAASNAATAAAEAEKAAATPPPAAVEPDPEPVVELKPALRNVTLKRTKKVQNGIETSGLCSIM